MKEIQVRITKTVAVTSESASFIQTGDAPAPTCNKYQLLTEDEQKSSYSLRAGFEPAQEDPIGFQVQHLNHSAIAATGNQEETSQTWYHLGLCLVDEAL